MHLWHLAGDLRCGLNRFFQPCSLFLLFLISFCIPIYSRILRIQKITDFFAFNQKNGMSFSVDFFLVFQSEANFPQICMNIIELPEKERKSLPALPTISVRCSSLPSSSISCTFLRSFRFFFCCMAFLFAYALFCYPWGKQNTLYMKKRHQDFN